MEADGVRGGSGERMRSEREPETERRPESPETGPWAPPAGPGEPERRCQSRWEREKEVEVPVGLAGLSPSVAAERAHEREEPGRRRAAHGSRRPPE